MCTMKAEFFMETHAQISEECEKMSNLAFLSEERTLNRIKMSIEKFVCPTYFAMRN